MGEFSQGAKRGAGQAVGRIVVTALVSGLLSFTGGYIIGDLPDVQVPSFENDD